MSTTKPKIAILTFCVGADYKKCMEPGLASKRAYAEKHGYDFLTGGEDVWDRTRPIPWSKFNFIRKYIDDYDYLFNTFIYYIEENIQAMCADNFLILSSFNFILCCTLS